MSVEAAAQDRVKCLLTIKRTSAHHRVKPPLTITKCAATTRNIRRRIASERDETHHRRQGRRRPKHWQNYDIQTETSRPMSGSTEKDYEVGYKKPQAKYSVIFIVFAC